MDDYMEVQHGLNCLQSAYNGEAGEKFKSTLNRIFDAGLVPEIEAHFNNWTPYLVADTYLACVSEHLDSEDLTGRLSMWRAYGRPTGVAFVMNNSLFVTPSDALKAYSSPVAYLNDQGFARQFSRVVDNINSEADFVRTQGRDAIKSLIFHMFRSAALCTKHLGFLEEQEWRVVYSPSVELSPYLIKDIQSIRGVPQPIYKIPLKDIPKEGFVGAEIPALLDRIIIGPSEYPLAMREAFLQLLTDADVKEPEKKVFLSDIPIRR